MPHLVAVANYLNGMLKALERIADALEKLAEK